MSNQIEICTNGTKDNPSVITWINDNGRFEMTHQEAWYCAQNILEMLRVAGFKPAPLNNDHEDDGA